MQESTKFDAGKTIMQDTSIKIAVNCGSPRRSEPQGQLGFRIIREQLEVVVNSECGGDAVELDVNIVIVIVDVIIADIKIKSKLGNTLEVPF